MAKGDPPTDVGRVGWVGWVAIQVGILWLLAMLAALGGVLPGLGLRAGALALVAGVAFAAAAWWRAGSLPEPAAARPSALVAAVALALGLHGWAAARARVPLGYDFGFYKAAFQAYEHGVPRHPPPWLTSQFEPALPALHAVLHGVAGLSATGHLTALWAVLSCALVPAAFVAARAIAGTRAGAIAAGLAAVSYTQAQAHAYLYEKNALALVLVVTALALLRRQAWVASGILLAGVACLNRPTALLALLAFPLAVLPDLRQWRGWATTAGIGVALALPVWLAWPKTFFATGSGIVQESAATLSTGAAASGGTFLTGWDYLAHAAAYLPFAVVGVALAWRWPALRTTAIAAAVAGLYVALRLPLHLRFLLMADAVAVVLAAPGLLALLPRGRAGLAAVFAVLLLAAAPTFLEATRPSVPHAFVTPQQLHAIAALQDLPPDATLVADNLRAPYVYAEAGHLAYGPGLFDDPHDRAAWGRFWDGLDGPGLAQFMAPYGPDVDVVQLNEPGPDWGSASLHEPGFTLLRDSDGVKVWHYEGDA